MLQYEGYQFELFPEPEISRPNTEPDGAGTFCVACNAIPGDTGVVVTRSVGLASCLAVVTGAGGLTVCKVKSPASAPSLLTTTGVKDGAAGAAAAVLAGVAVCEVGPEAAEVVAADASPGSLLAEVVELSVVTESGSTNSCVTVVPCAVPVVAVVVAVVVVLVVLVVVVAAVVVVVVEALLEVAVVSVEVIVLAPEVVEVAGGGGGGGGATKTAALVLATTVATACVMACSTTTLVAASDTEAFAVAASATAFAAAASATACAAALAAAVVLGVVVGVTGVSLDSLPPPVSPPPPPAGFVTVTVTPL
jgi:hypothetical protein